MKKLSVLLVAMAVAVSASAGIHQKMSRSIKSNKITPKTEMTKNPVKMSQLKGKVADIKFGVITTQPEGELKTYNRAGQGVYVSSGYLYCSQQDGTRMDIVWGEDGKVYLKDILFNFGADTWVEGTYDPDASTITVPLDQSLYYSETYEADINLCWGYTYATEDEEIGFQRDLDVTEAVYFIDNKAGTINLLNTAGPTELDSYDINSYLGYGLTAYWTDDDSWYGNLEWNTVLTEREPVVIPDVIYDIPEGCQVYDYNRASYCIYNSWFGIGLTETDGKIHVAFDMTNGDVYIQNPSWWHDGNDTWVKGTYDWMTGIITVPTGQYLSFSEAYEYGVQLGWGSTYVYTETDEDGEESYYMGYELDERTTEIQFMIDGDCLYLLGCEGDAEAEFPNNYNATGLMTYYSDDMSMTALEFVTHDEPMGEIINLVPAIPANPTADEWYDCGDETGYSRFYFTLPTEDIDGNKLDPEYLSYSIFTDNDEMFVFEGSEDAYYFDLNPGEVMTEIPYWFYSDAVDWSDYYCYFYRTNENDNPMFSWRIGIQVYYTIDGVKNASDIVYLEVFPHTGVSEMNAGKTVANVRYFNVAGQEMAQPEGLTIQVTTYTDGTSSAVKVVK